MPNVYKLVSSLEAEIAEIPPDSIVSRSIYQDDTCKVVLFGFSAGQELSEHTASKPAILHVLDGSALLTLGDEAHEVSDGAWVHMQANLSHSVEAKTRLIMLLILIA